MFPGEKCPCGAWVAPAFHISSGKVDKIPSQPVMPRTHTPVLTDAAALSTSPPLSQPRQIGAVAAFPGPNRGGGRASGHLPLSERTSARLSTVQPVAAVQPRVVSSLAQTAAVQAAASSDIAEPAATISYTSETTSAVASTGDASSAAAIQYMDIEVEQQGPETDNRDLESGINSIHMDVDSG